MLLYYVWLSVFLLPLIASTCSVMTFTAALRAPAVNQPCGVSVCSRAPSPDPSDPLVCWLDCHISAVVRYPNTSFTLCFQSQMHSEPLSTSLFSLLVHICSSILQAMGKADLDLCFIFLPLVCCLCGIKLL